MGGDGEKRREETKIRAEREKKKRNYGGNKRKKEKEGKENYIMVESGERPGGTRSEEKRKLRERKRN
jgi:hypothetical protein